MNKQQEALKLALEALEETLRTLDDENAKPGGAISDTIWYSEHETLFDYIAAQITAIREALAEQPAQQPPTVAELLCVCGAEWEWRNRDWELVAIPQPAQQQEPVTVLPDGSAFAVMSYPLPKDHWLYADRQYNEGEYEPVELGKPVLTHELRNAVVSAVRYAIRGATNCGKEVDFDPDALVQNAVYALCGPFTSPPASKPLSGYINAAGINANDSPHIVVEKLERVIEAKLKEKNT